MQLRCGWECVPAVVEAVRWGVRVAFAWGNAGCRPAIAATQSKFSSYSRVEHSQNWTFGDDEPVKGIVAAESRWGGTIGVVSIQNDRVHCHS
jgi:hypothetical protein